MPFGGKLNGYQDDPTKIEFSLEGPVYGNPVYHYDVATREFTKIKGCDALPEDMKKLKATLGIPVSPAKSPTQRFLGMFSSSSSSSGSSSPTVSGSLTPMKSGGSRKTARKRRAKKGLKRTTRYHR
jgi:hypothetical protein